MIQKLKQFKRRYLYDAPAFNGKVSTYHILGWHFDNRKWYYLKPEYEAAGKDWTKISWYLESHGKR